MGCGCKKNNGSGKVSAVPTNARLIDLLNSTNLINKTVGSGTTN